jgi:hypothetical protein
LRFALETPHIETELKASFAGTCIMIGLQQIEFSPRCVAGFGGKLSSVSSATGRRDQLVLIRAITGVVAALRLRCIERRRRLTSR